MQVFVNSIAQIIPDVSISDTVAATGKMICVEPDYSDFFDSRTIRRISRIIKMGTASAWMALRNASLSTPDGIIVGTGFGCLEDTSIFLRKLISNKEETLNPTPFIFSTHNSISAQIALQVSCYGYNSTYSHRHFSFESALLDAFLLIKEETVNDILVGGVDEITDDSYDLLRKIGYYKSDDIAGEGAHFFVLSNQQKPDSFAQLNHVYFAGNTDIQSFVKRVKELTDKLSISAVMLSSHPDKLNQNDEIIGDLFHQKNPIFYKHKSGEYATSGGYGFAEASKLIKENPDIKNVLLYNQYADTHHSIIVLSAC